MHDYVPSSTNEWMTMLVAMGVWAYCLWLIINSASGRAIRLFMVLGYTALYGGFSWAMGTDHGQPWILGVLFFFVSFIIFFGRRRHR